MQYFGDDSWVKEPWPFSDTEVCTNFYYLKTDARFVDACMLQ